MSAEAGIPGAACALPTPRAPMLAGCLLLALLVFGFGGWAGLARLSGAVHAPGTVALAGNRQVVQSAAGGVVAEIRVAEGSAVAAGALLIRLDDSLLQAELSVVEGQYQELRAREGRLEAERDGAAAPRFAADLVALADARPELADLLAAQRRLFAARRAAQAEEAEGLARQRAQLAARLSGIAAQATALDRQQDLIAEELVDQRRLLDSGLAQAARVRALEREAARLDGMAGELAAARAEAEEQRAALDIARARLDGNRREAAMDELRETGFRLVDLAGRRRSLQEQIARLEIRAPVAGIVHALQVTTPRAVLETGATLAFIVPQDRPLVVTVRIRPADIEAVHPGQPATLRFAAFDRRSAPPLAGHLARIAPDAEVDASSGAAFYAAEVALDPGEVARLGPGARLLPGMPVEVFLRTAERSPLDYLLAPLTQRFARALREG